MFGKPYNFSVQLPAGERNVAVRWELVRVLVTSLPDGTTYTTRNTVNSGAGTSFTHTFTSSDELYDWEEVRFFVDSNRDGALQPAKEPKKEADVDVTQDRAAIWQCRLEKEKTVHAGYIYEGTFGVNVVLDRLQGATSNINFTRNTDPTAVAVYVPETNTIRVTDVQSTSIDTIIHESVHALDDANDWYMFPPWALGYFYLDKSEALGYTTAHMFTILFYYREFEDELQRPMPQPAALSDKWYSIIGSLQRLANGNGQYDIVTAGVTRDVRSPDIADVCAKVGLCFDMSALMAAYQAEIDAKGIAMTLEITATSAGIVHTIPSVFLD